MLYCFYNVALRGIKFSFPVIAMLQVQAILHWLLGGAVNIIAIEARLYFGENISKEASYLLPQWHETSGVFFFFLVLTREYTHHRETAVKKGRSGPADTHARTSMHASMHAHTHARRHEVRWKKKVKENKKHCPEVNSTLKQHPSLIWEHSCSSGTTRVMQHWGPWIKKSICKTIEGCHFEKAFHQWKSY